MFNRPTSGGHIIAAFFVVASRHHEEEQSLPRTQYGGSTLYKTLLEYHRQQNIQPVCCNTSAETSDGMCTNGFADELAITEAIEHSSVGAEETAPAHADGGEHSDGIVVNNTFGDEAWHQADSGTHGAEGGHGEGNQGTILESEEPVEDEVDFVGRPADDGHAFVSHAKVFAVFSCSAKGEHHHDGGDAEHAWDDGEADVYTVLAAVKQRVEETHEHAAFRLEGDLLLVAALAFVKRRIQLGIGL